jgi:glycosyltransferase involved in cell wall biosynthesis
MAKLGIRMINIDFFPLLGGAQMHTLRVCRFLSKKGVDVQVITRHHPGLAQHETIEGIPVYRTPIWHRSKIIASLSFTFFTLRELLASRKHFQVIHSHEMLSPMTIGLIASELLGTKLVVNPHRGGYLGDVYKLTRKRPLTGRLRLKWVRRRGDAFVTCSREMAAELEAEGIAKEKIHVIPNAIYTEHFRPVKPAEKIALRKQVGMQDGVWACYAGRLSAEKGLNLLVQVWVKVILQMPTARLLIVGDGDQRPALEALTRQLGLDEHVHFTGPVPETLQYLQACDLYVQPSYTEGLPVSMLEAMACGLPVLATGVGGVTDILCDGKNGIVIPARDADRLEEGLRRLLSSETLRLHLGAQARQDVVAYCDIEQVGQALLNLYCQLVGGAQPAFAASSGSGI